jgi:hypothetical protein
LVPALKPPLETFPPRLLTQELARIQDWIQERASPHVNVRVANPSYRRVQVSAEVRLKPMGDAEGLLRRLNQEVREHLSPWIFQQAAAQLPERCISRSAVAVFVRTRPYVEQVARLELLLSERSEDDLGGLPGSRVPVPQAVPSSRAEYLITAEDHLLQAL